MSDFVSDKTQNFFKIQFFEKFYDVWINNIISPDHLTGYNRNFLSSLIKYLLDLSFEFSEENISNWTKLSNLNDILSMDISTIYENFKGSRLMFTNSELKNIIFKYYENCMEKDKLLKKL